MRERVIKPAEHTTYGSLARFKEAAGHPTGVLTVMHRGLPIDIWHDPRGFDTTTVFFHATLDKSRSHFPAFTGVGISEALPTNRVFISDPSLYLNGNLHLAWYAGNHRQDKLQWVIRGILRSLIPTDHRTVMFGSSGGGFAALYYAAHHPGAIAVPVNPQTNLSKYIPSAVDRYGRLGWNLSGENLAAQIPATTNLVNLYRRRSPGRVFYVQNRNDSSHMKNHLEPFIDALPEEHLVHPVIVDGAPGHNPPAKTITRAVLAAAINGLDGPPSTDELAATVSS